MKKIFTIAFVCGLAFVGFCGTTNNAGDAALTQPEQFTYKIYTDKISPEIFRSNLKHLAGAKEGETNLQMLLRFFRENGAEIKQPDSLFISETHGLLFVQAPLAKQHIVERLVIAIENNVQPFEVH